MIRKPNVIAGLKCPPETCPSADTITAIATPLATATPIKVGSWLALAATAAPAPMKISVNAPMNSATPRRNGSSSTAQDRKLVAGRTAFRAGAPRPTLHAVRRRVTFSRNLTLSLSRSCRCYCKYCAFATHAAHLYDPEQVCEMLDGAARRRVKELLVLTGERPEVNGEVRARLRAYGHDDFTGYVVWTCERALERGLLPHTNLGVLEREDLARLREVTASQGLMLESSSERLMRTVHAGSPTKHPAARLATIRAAGELKIPFTSGILVGIGETAAERADSLRALAAVHAEHGHIQELILHNFVPHQRYYGREPARIADEAAREYWRTGIADGRPSLALPEWACPIDVEEMKRLVALARELMPDVAVQVPPNLSDWWSELVAAGASDLGGLSANGDHISPEHPFPSPSGVRKRLREEGVALTERLCVYPEYIDPEWISRPVMAVIKARC